VFRGDTFLAMPPVVGALPEKARGPVAPVAFRALRFVVAGMPSRPPSATVSRACFRSRVPCRVLRLLESFLDA